jgi:Uma2 family endonuclease
MAIKLITPAGPRLLTVEEWAQLPTGDQYELIDGVLRKRLVNQNQHEFAVLRLGYFVTTYVDRPGVHGSAFGSNTKFRVRGRRGIMPDLSVVLGAKVDAIDPAAAYNIVGPDLAVEVLSPEQDADYVEERLSDYWKLGTAEVWVVNATTETVTGYARGAHEFTILAVARHEEEFNSRLLIGLSFSVKPRWMRRP